MTLSNKSGLFPRKFTISLFVGIRSISSLFNRFLCNVDMLFCPYCPKSPSSELSFLIELVSTVATPIKSQKYDAVKTSVIPHTNPSICIAYYFIR